MIKDVFGYIESEMEIKLSKTDKHNIKLQSKGAGGSGRIMDYLLLEYPDADIRGSDDTTIEELLKRKSYKKVKKVV